MFHLLLGSGWCSGLLCSGIRKITVNSFFFWGKWNTFHFYPRILRKPVLVRLLMRSPKVPSGLVDETWVSRFILYHPISDRWALEYGIITTGLSELENAYLNDFGKSGEWIDHCICFPITSGKHEKSKATYWVVEVRTYLDNFKILKDRLIFSKISFAFEILSGEIFLRPLLRLFPPSDWQVKWETVPIPQPTLPIIEWVAS